MFTVIQLTDCALPAEFEQGYKEREDRDKQNGQNTDEKLSNKFHMVFHHVKHT